MPATKKNPNQLLLIKQSAKKLSPQQVKFNKNIKRIEKERKYNEKVLTLLSNTMEAYGKEVYPLEQNMAKISAELVPLWYQHLQSDTKMKKTDQKHLSDLIDRKLQEIIRDCRDLFTPELKEIFQAIRGKNLEEIRRDEFNEMKEDFKTNFSQMGVDINLDELDSDLSEAEVLQKMKSIFEGLEEKMAEPKDTRKKTKKQLAAEERARQAEELKTKSVASIYKRLAKVLHPDLEQAPQAKDRKEQLMKELTIAYKKNDLHTLLRLELQWMENEDTNIEQLTNDKLVIYNQVLEEQISEIKMEFLMQLEHPRYFPLRKYLDDLTEVDKDTIRTVVQELKIILKHAELSLNNLKGKNARKEMQSMIKALRFEAQTEDLMEELLGNFFR